MKKIEPQFLISCRVPASKVGITIVHLGKVSELQVSHIEERASSKNVPRGSITEVFLRLVVENQPIQKRELSAKFRALVGSANSFHSTFTRLLKQKQIIVKSEKVSLGKGTK